MIGMGHDKMMYNVYITTMYNVMTAANFYYKYKCVRPVHYIVLCIYKYAI